MIDRSFQGSEQATFYHKRITFWDQVAQQQKVHGRGSSGYHRRLRQLFQYHIAPGQRVLEIGCGEGDLLASVAPSYGLGIDFSPHMIERAKRKYPALEFACADGLSFQTEQQFDVIILSDLINDVWDVQSLFENIGYLSHEGTRILINYYSRLWTPMLVAATFFRLAQQTLEQSWLTTEDVNNLLTLAGLEQVRTSQEVLLPLSIPLLEPFCNRFLVRLWPFRHFALSNLTIARPRSGRVADGGADKPSVSVVVPARNEAGNIAGIFEQLPLMGSSVELIFVEGNSSDDTFAEIERQIERHPSIDCRLFKQTGKGKGDAVRLGFSHAKGDVLMILDADITVLPEYLPRFYEAIAGRAGEFVNGVRLVYPMEKQAMRFFNLLGNKFFSSAFSWLIGQRVKDTLCGTKVISRENYRKIAENRSYFGDFDPFGDFDLLFGAAKQNLKIVDVPVRYHERKYGTTNIQRWKHGLLLLRMVAFAAARIKFI